MICTNFCKRILIGFTLFFISILAVAQETSTAAPAIKTFAMQSDITGAASNSVNLFSGDVTFPLNLVSLPGHNGLDASVSLTYNSNVQDQVSTWNLENPAGIVGLGWSLDVPKIVSDYKQTGAKEDDEYYLVQSGTSNKLIRTTQAYDYEAGAHYYIYETQNYQFWKIRYYYDYYEVSGPGFSGGANKWVITTEDGTQFIYGDQYSGRNTVQYMVRWSNWMGNSAQINNQSRLAVVWNLSQVVNKWNEKITFDYEQVEQYVGSTVGQKHTEASYLKQITDVYGRKIQFFYEEKNPQFYTEPHTERPEPDAYQESYETKYLDHIDVIQEDFSKLLSVKLAYSTLIGVANGAAKQLLTSIVQKNATGGSLPGMQFSYNVDGGPTHGFIKTIKYPGGGAVTYNYSGGKVLPRSNRQRTITAPAGYAEPKVFVGEDYVAVIWREYNGTHDKGVKGLVLYMYTWVGEWKEQYIGGIGACPLTDDGKEFQYFDVAIQKDFFAVLTEISSNYHNNLQIVYRSPHELGKWSTNPIYNQDYGGRFPRLLSGTNFIAVGPVVYPQKIKFYAYSGGSWNVSMPPDPGSFSHHYYTAANNFFISHSGYPNNDINFYYLTEDKKWVKKSLPSSLEFTSDDRNNTSFWYAGNSMAIVMANHNPEYAYLWDFTYNSFFQDIHDVNGNEIFGSLDDWRPVYMENNSMVGVFGRLARYDGYYWYTTNADVYTSFTDDYYSYGDDYVVRPTSYQGIGFYRGKRLVFDPNQLAWQPDVLMYGPDEGQDVANAGIDYYYFGNGYYYRKPNGTWEKKITFSASDMANKRFIPISGFPRFDVIVDVNPCPVERVVVFKNGEAQQFPLYGQRIIDKSNRFKSHGVSYNTIVSFPSNFSAHEDANVLQLNRLVSNDITGTQVDYPVTYITVNDGGQDRYTSFDYDLQYAFFDETGSTARYNKVTAVPGSANPASRPFGYTTTYFNNGLTSIEAGVPVLSSLWLGSPYKTEVYDNNNQLISSTKTDYTVYSKQMNNSDGTPVNTAYYFRPTSTSATQDGIQTFTANVYDQNTGMIKESTINDFNSKQNQLKITYKYFWEQYDPTRSLNILSSVIQTKKTITTASGQLVSDVQAVTWKNWNNVFAPHKSYQWTRTGNADFDFNNWSGTGEPSADWIKKTQIDALDATGNIIQMTNR
jgi:hypothetical protein